MERPYETKIVNGYTVEIWNDPEPMNPREDYDPLGTIVAWFPGCDFSDSGFPSRFRNHEEFWEHMEEHEPNAVIFPFSIRDQSYVMFHLMKVDPKEYIGQHYGYMYATTHDLIREYGEGVDIDRNKVFSVFRSELESYQNYVNGQAYFWSILGFDGETIESCSGYEDPEHAMREAIEVAEGMAPCAHETAGFDTDELLKHLEECVYRAARDLETSEIDKAAWPLEDIDLQPGYDALEYLNRAIQTIRKRKEEWTSSRF